jgi:hypothetical protein
VLLSLLQQHRHRLEVARLPDEHFEKCLGSDDGYRSLLYYVQRQEHHKQNYSVSKPSFISTHTGSCHALCMTMQCALFCRDQHTGLQRPLGCRQPAAQAAAHWLKVCLQQSSRAQPSHA